MSNIVNIHQHNSKPSQDFLLFLMPFGDIEARIITAIISNGHSLFVTVKSIQAMIVSCHLVCLELLSEKSKFCPKIIWMAS